MRFAVAHKTASYLMVASAFLALLTGGGVQPIIGLLGVLGMIGSWWWEPPRVRLDRWALPWTIASVLVMVFVAVTGVLAGDYFGAGATFLVYLVVAKAFNRRSSKDWQQMYLLSFLMLVAGSVLNDGLLFAVAFLGFVLSTTWALILSHLRREMEDNFLLKHADDRASERVEVRRILESRRIVGGRFFVGTGLVSLGVFALSTALFLTIPRVGAGFFMKKKQGLQFAGFKEGVKLGGHGTIKNDETIVMRVQIEGPYQGRDAPYVHWRGVAFDQYSQGEWKRSRNATSTETVDDSPSRSRERRHIQYAGLGGGRPDELAAARDGAIKQNIWLEPLGSDALFGASMPIAYETDSPREPHGRYERNDDIRLEHGAGVRYTVWSDIAPPDPEVLRAAPARLPRGFEIYLQLPREITQRTRDLAAEITAGSTTTYDKALAIETWLSSELGYTLELEEHGAREPVDFFLFDRKVGHCEYFASAFAVLARAAGVPTREVNGFLGGEWNEYDDYIAVRAGDAHSWNEVFFAGVGWVTFDATPASQDRLGRGGNGLGARLRRFIDTMRFQWMKWVIDYDLKQQLGMFKDIGGAFKRAGAWLKARWRDLKAWAADHALIAAALGAALLALIGWRLWRRLRRGGGGGAAERVRPRPRSPIATQYARVLTRLEKRGHARAPAITPRELARDVASRGLPFAAALGELTEIYYAAQWGGDDAPGLLERARALAADIEAALLPR